MLERDRDHEEKRHREQKRIQVSTPKKICLMINDNDVNREKSRKRLFQGKYKRNFI